ncbi:MAG: hypothetical protein K8J09_15155 [Planctomycetes bacterium]|nr:hypothetical protein [Planctomycetota bacterium]
MLELVFASWGYVGQKLGHPGTKGPKHALFLFAVPWPELARTPRNRVETADAVNPHLPF